MVLYKLISDVFVFELEVFCIVRFHNLFSNLGSFLVIKLFSHKGWLCLGSFMATFTKVFVGLVFDGAKV